ncbi:Peptidoglycan hydrolase, Autolysin2 [Streptococcus sp. DD10]|uniref:glucosaminidase domain-containing protein n=1 Tax=Streptococcus sp. DD10 TaxID=1777878 RepID=UPI00079665EB|nr:glucosaminidase domain-containing protein [Streptococcus sp. DD10]KXT76313.1 Peptidoglycan hydrolase, Autolysin2 [Streptococcus sp. DD10]
MKRTQNVLVLAAVGLTALALVNSIANRSFTAGANESQYQSGTNQTEVFISQVGETARQIAQNNDLYASVMIAQAILESSSGGSGLAAAPHYNLFGIKGQYAGQSVTMSTWEDDGSGNAYTINAVFRSYPSYAESLADYASLIRQPLYSGAWRSNTNSYQDATAALTGLYATDTNYNTKLNSLIQQYNLTQYDTISAQGLENATVSGLVYNTYRGSYTSQEVLDIDIAWANRTRQ